MTRGMLLGIGAVCLAAVLARLRAADDPPSLPKVAAPGTFRLRVTSQGNERTAWVHIPKNYRKQDPAPLVVALHGAGGSGLHMLEKNHWAEKAEESGCVVVAPDGLPSVPRAPSNFRANPTLWNSGQLRRQSHRARIDDVEFMRILLDVLAERVPYDAQRVLATGHSNGGGMCFRLATEMPERFAAIATVAGQVALEDPRPGRPLPTLYIFGTEDRVMPRAGGIVELPWGSRTTEPLSVYLERWARAIGCRETPETASHEGGIERQIYPSRTGGPALELVLIEGHGHHYPGGERMLSEEAMGPDRPALDATDEIWKWFDELTSRTK